jgi:hypothetical protein
LTEQLSAPLRASQDIGRLTPDAYRVIQHEWQAFGELASDPGVQRFCAFETSYNGTINFNTRPSPGHELDFLTFPSPATEFDIASAGTLLDTAYRRLDTFVTGLVTTYCETKRMPIPEVDDTAGTGAILQRIFKGGLSNVYRYMNSNEGLAKKTDWLESNWYHLPTTLLMTAGQLCSGHLYEQVSDTEVSPAVPQAEIDGATDQALQRACQLIVDGQKTTLPKDANDTQKLYAAAFNCLSTIYHQGKDTGFRKELFPLIALLDRSEIANAAEQIQVIGQAATHQLIHKATAKRLTRFNDIIEPITGVRYELPEDKRRWSKSVEAEEFMDNSPNFEPSLGRLIPKLYQTHLARTFVKAIASGELRYSQIMGAMQQLQSRPLAGLATESIVVPSVALDWEILPWELIMDDTDRAPMPEIDAEKPKHPRELDWGRIVQLREYIRSWGSGYIARAVPSSEVKSLSPDKQYYIAVLPETNGDEHAMADHPETGNGLYMWRAETAKLRDIVGRNQDLTWQTVFCHPKKIARSLGARCLYHTENLAFNVLDYMTCPPEKIATRRYAVGRGAMQLVRMAQTTTTHEAHTSLG